RLRENRADLACSGTAKNYWLSEFLRFGVLKVSLPREAREQGESRRAQTVGSEERLSVQFYPGSQTFKKLSFSGAEKSKKISFRRDVVWSQRMICEQNEGAYRNEHL
ncbi:hypothetical protein PRIPAC_71487, partial [Pristionchus pacificus]|uniref:Uncharacterized protein n=1 Tax=Pristionchus pacificus TaxID=54126 RepID=A0A2A6CSX0_PRIPA